MQQVFIVLYLDLILYYSDDMIQPDINNTFDDIVKCFTSSGTGIMNIILL